MENGTVFDGRKSLQDFYGSQRPSLLRQTFHKLNQDELLNKTLALQQKPSEVKKPNFRTTVYKFSQHNIKAKRSGTMSKIRQSLPRAISKDHESIVDPVYSDPTVLNNYQIMTHIGKGAYATVSLAVEKSTLKTFAIKIYDKNAVKDPQRLENVLREIKNLKMLNHKNIANLVHAVSDRRKVFIVMQNAGKNSLHSLIRRRQHKVFPEPQAKFYFSQILQAMACCHQHNICHRDIKLQNILVNPSNEVKLIDFGFSVVSKGRLNTYCGTPSYMAPQIAAKGFYEGWQVDMWSCGILLYVMLCGGYPFRGMDQKELYWKIRVGKYTWREDLDISVGAKRVVSKMLRVAGETRCPAKLLLQDKWFNE